MQIYLPIADLPVNVFVILAMGLAVGFISGMFGIGGGFLMTPLLIFLGISPAVAVASVTGHIAASSMSGAISYWRRRAIDLALAFMLLAGGIVGTAFGVWLFTLLRAIGQLDITIGLSYVLLLGIVGALMVAESVRAIMRARQGKPVELRRPGSHTWIHGLPFKLRFKRSRIYVSAIPVWAIGFIIGFIGAVMGIGGGFLLVPMLIYVLRVPTATVIGTSMVLTLVTMASATVMHAATNHLVDAVLALILMVGGVIGAQFGARAGQKMSGERLRLLLGLLVLAVGIRFALDLVLPPESIYSIRPLGHANMTPRAPFAVLAALGALAASSVPAAGERLVASLSNHRVMVTSNFTGEELVLFGGIEQDAASRPRRGGYDIVVTVTGPRQTMVTFRKAQGARHLGQRRFARIRECARLSRGAVEPAARRHHQCRNAAPPAARPRQHSLAAARQRQYRRCRKRRSRSVSPSSGSRAIMGSTARSSNGVTFLTPALFRASIPLPAEVPVGTYEVDVGCSPTARRSRARPLRSRSTSRASSRSSPMPRATTACSMASPRR